MKKWLEKRTSPRRAPETVERCALCGALTDGPTDCPQCYRKLYK